MNEEMSKEGFEAMLHDASEQKRAMIMLFQDKDGNWRGAYYKTGAEQPVFERQIGPDTVLQLLLTHNGK